MQPTPTRTGNLDAAGHLTGKSIYVDDIPVMQGTVYIHIFDAPVAHGIIRHLDYAAAEQLDGVVKVFSYRDILGENQIGGIIPDEPLLAEHEVHFWGQPILLIAAETEDIARHAAQLIRLEIDPLPVITDPRVAFQQGKLLSASRQLTLGDVDQAFAQCVHVIEGTAETGGQEHLYLETQGAYAYPTEHGGIRVHSSTQGPTAVQRTIAKVLGIAMHHIEIDVTRLGGGFGGKEDQASAWAAMTALVAWSLGKPAKCILHRMDDMRMTGKRNPYSSDFKIGLDADYHIQAFQATYYQNGGAAADLSPAILERTLFHATNAYHIPHVAVQAHSCKTNLPPNTAFRGFGGPQGMFVMEAAIDKAAQVLGVSPLLIQSRNLMQEGNEFPYGQLVAGCEARHTWEELSQRANVATLQADIADFNAQHRFRKRGLAMMPICFGISFTNTMMNHARALVHIYSDGSVSVSTGAVEMGQGVNTKMIQVAAHALGIRLDRIRLETTNTGRVANTSPTAASAGADLNGNALLDACQQLRERLQHFYLHTFGQQLHIRPNEEIWINGERSTKTWEQVIQTAFVHRINLSAKGHYATPDIYFDKERGKGHPFAYHVFGTALTVCTIDCIKGTYSIDLVEVVHDFGKSFSQDIDLGQVEGGLVQGIGWMTMEEVVYNDQGKLLSNALSTYKVPDIYAAPQQINVHFLDTEGAKLAILKSKAVGEPPLMYGIGAYFALANAVRAFNPRAAIHYSAPMTPEKVLMALYTK